ncbi:UNVERIFIED_CONTAM: ABC transporter transmembrane domain-containing protein [Campylobacter lari]
MAAFLQATFYSIGTGMSGIIVEKFLNAEVINKDIPFNLSGFITACVLMVAVFVLYATFRLIQNKLFITATFSITSKMRTLASKNLLYMPISYHDKQKAGDQISTLTNDINNASMSLGQLFNDTFGNFFTIVITIIIMFCYSVTVSAIVIPISLIFIAIS